MTDAVQKLHYEADFINRQKSCSVRLWHNNPKTPSDRCKGCEPGVYLLGGGGSAFQSPDIMGFILFSRELWSELHLNVNQQE